MDSVAPADEVVQQLCTLWVADRMTAKAASLSPPSLKCAAAIMCLYFRVIDIRAAQQAAGSAPQAVSGALVPASAPTAADPTAAVERTPGKLGGFDTGTTTISDVPSSSSGHGSRSESPVGMPDAAADYGGGPLPPRVSMSFVHQAFVLLRLWISSAISQSPEQQPSPASRMHPQLPAASIGDGSLGFAAELELSTAKAVPADATPEVALLFAVEALISLHARVEPPPPATDHATADHHRPGSRPGSQPTSRPTSRPASRPASRPTSPVGCDSPTQQPPMAALFQPPNAFVEEVRLFMEQLLAFPSLQRPTCRAFAVLLCHRTDLLPLVLRAALKGRPHEHPAATAGFISTVAEDDALYAGSGGGGFELGGGGSAALAEQSAGGLSTPAAHEVSSRTISTSERGGGQGHECGRELSHSSAQASSCGTLLNSNSTPSQRTRNATIGGGLTTRNMRVFSLSLAGGAAGGVPPRDGGGGSGVATAAEAAEGMLAALGGGASDAWLTYAYAYALVSNCASDMRRWYKGIEARLLFLALLHQTSALDGLRDLGLQLSQALAHSHYTRLLPPRAHQLPWVISTNPLVYMAAPFRYSASLAPHHLPLLPSVSTHRGPSQHTGCAAFFPRPLFFSSRCACSATRESRCSSRAWVAAPR